MLAEQHHGVDETWTMIGFRGISDDVAAVGSPEGSCGPTKEAQEATNLRLYERALREQRAGNDEAARATFQELQSQPLLSEINVVRAALVYACSDRHASPSNVSYVCALLRGVY